MDLLLRLVAMLATAVFLAATGLMLLTFRRARRVTTASLLVPVLMSVAILLLYCAFLRATPSAGWVITNLVAGVALGAIWARTHTLLRARDGGIRSRANLWYLAVWACVLTLNQLVVVLAGRASTILVGLLVFSTGIAVGNGWTLLRRLRVLRAAALLMLAITGAVAGADDVLLLLPREFDIRPISGWSRDKSDVRQFTAKDLAAEPAPFRFRGEDVTQEANSRTVHHPGEGCSVEILYEHEYRAKLTRGSLTGRWLTHQRNFNRACKGSPDGEYMRVNHQGRVTGQADASGRLELTVQVTDSEILDRQGGGWVHRDQHIEPWSFGLAFQLPVGELQSTQKLSPRPTQVPLEAPRAGAPRGRDGGPRADAAAPEGSRSTASGESEAAPDGESRTEPTSEAVGAPRDPAEGDEPDGRGQPVSPLAAAGAAAGAAALSLLGAGWMLASSGVRPGDLLSAPPVEDVEPPAPAPEPRDGDVRAETGEVWSAPDGGWVSRNLYELDRGARRLEVERAQARSDEESRRQSAEIDAELRASEGRQREAAAKQAEAARVFELEASFQPEAIEPYQPGWADGVTWCLEWGEYGADSGVSLLGEITGEPGKLIGTVYTVAKETVKGTSEGVAAYARGQGGHFAEEGSAWVIAERAGIGLAKGGAKLGLDKAAGKVMEGASRLAGKVLPGLADLGSAPVVGVLGDVASGAGEGAVRQTVGIAAGNTLGSQNLQKPVNWGVEAATGEKL